MKRNRGGAWGLYVGGMAIVLLATSATAVHAGQELSGAESKKAEHRRHEGGFTCGGKRTCKQMDSCEEAKFYLRECGLYRLDGDGDGIPCESLCR